MKRFSTLVALLACGALLGATALWPAGAAQATPHFSRTNPSTVISFTLELRANDAGLEKFVRASHDPHSTLYGRTLTPAAVGARFGLPLAAIAHVQSLLAARGVTVTATYPQRMTLDAHADVATLERLFHVDFRDLPASDGRLYPAPLGRQPTVPRSLSRWIDGVVGLDTRPQARADLLFPLRPQDISTAYDLNPLYKAGFTGRGQTIGVISFQDVGAGDYELYEQQFGVHGPALKFVKLGTVTDPGYDEVDLDVEAIRGAAPKAKIIVYEAPNTSSGELAMMNRWVSGPAAIGSDSWGQCDVGIPASSAFRRAMDRVLATAEAAGKTLFVATGDAGAYDCQRANFSDQRLTVEFPADSPHVVAVGGTLLGLTSSGGYLGEAAWVEPLTNAGGGGGIDPVDAKPSWQSGVAPGTHRGIPDVSAVASAGSPWLIATRFGADQPQVIAHISGTSAATPFWAASMSLAEQYAHAQGVPSECFLAPLLYGVDEMKNPPYSPAFHDVVYGTNRYYPAKTGWDYATGIGSPDVWNLTRDLVAYLKANPSSCRS